MSKLLLYNKIGLLYWSAKAVVRKQSVAEWNGFEELFEFLA